MEEMGLLSFRKPEIIELHKGLQRQRYGMRRQQRILHALRRRKRNSPIVIHIDSISSGSMSFHQAAWNLTKEHGIRHQAHCML